MNKTSLRFQQIISAVLVLLVIGLLGWLSTQFKTELDWTANHRNTLTAASIKQLAGMKDAIKVTAFAPTGGDNRAEIAQFLNRYVLVKKNFTVEYVDPTKNPSKVREYNISAAGDLVLEYQGRRETVHANDMNEAPLTQALQRLTFAEERWVVFLQGHGEHDLADPGAPGYGAFVQLLKDNGLKARALNLGATPHIPSNAAALIVAGPRAALLPAEAGIIADYVAHGGNLLWLSDPDTAGLPSALAQALGMQFDVGTAVFPEYAALGGDAGVFITSSYPLSPITNELRENTAFPLIRSISADPTAKPDPAWKPQPFLQTSQQAWLETGPMKDEIGFDPDKGDKQGPLTLGLLLTRSVKLATAPVAIEGKAKAEEHAQRVALVGDSDFLSNALLSQLGNSKLGLNMVRWLASRDDQIDVTVPSAKDASLDLSPMQTLVLELIFLLLIPVALLAFGILRWLARRRR